MKISDILRFFGLLPQPEVFYIGGSDVLPMPLKGSQEQEALDILKANGVEAYTMGVIVKGEEKVVLK